MQACREELFSLYEVNIEKIPNGNLKSYALDYGNFRRLKFYVRPAFGDVITNTANVEVSGCGRRLSQLAVKPAGNERRAMVEATGGEILRSASSRNGKRPFYLSCCVCHKCKA